MAIEKEKLVNMLKTMVRIRTFEERIRKIFASGNIPGFVHLYTGEEASATGVCANLRPDDYVVSNHRGHGHLIAKGGRTDRMMAEIFGKKTGYCNGRGGSMHIADMELGILGANGIVGAGITIAGGAAISAQIRGTDHVTVCFLGDGATNTSRFHEGVNMAAVWSLPIVYIIENNLYSATVPISDNCKIINLSDRACAYGIPGKTVDGNDVLEVYKVAGEAIDRARKGDGPTLVECKTYRWHGHHQGDRGDYKPRQEVEEWLKKDPIPRFRKYLIEMGVLTEEESDKINQAMDEELDKAVKFAEESPFPTPEETLEDVYA